MSLKGHKVLRGATLNVLKTESLRGHGRGASQQMTKEGAKYERRPPRTCFLLLIKILMKSYQAGRKKEGNSQ